MRHKERRAETRVAEKAIAEETVDLLLAKPHPSAPSEDEVRVLAFLKWERAGHPAGDGVGFWLEAEKELSAGPG